MRRIDINNWKRKEIFDFFSSISNPFYVTCFNIDVTKLYQYTKKNQLSFYYSLIYLVNQSLNSVENFRYAIQDGQVVLLDERLPSFTILDKENELFKIITMEKCDDLFEFNQSASEKSENQQSFIQMESETSDLVYYTCLPWLDLTTLTNEMDQTNKNLKDDTVPRVGWGKYVNQNGVKKLNISLEVNHRFIDGVHIGKFAQNLEEAMNALE